MPILHVVSKKKADCTFNLNTTLILKQCFTTIQTCVVLQTSCCRSLGPPRVPKRAHPEHQAGLPFSCGCDIRVSRQKRLGRGVTGQSVRLWTADNLFDDAAAAVRSPVHESPPRLCCPESATSTRPATMSDVNKTIQKWHASFKKGTDFDSWGQLVEAIDEYQM